MILEFALILAVRAALAKDCPTAAPNTTPEAVTAITPPMVAIAKSAEQKPAKPHEFDLFIYFDVRKTPKALEVTASQPDVPKLIGTGDYNKAVDLYKAVTDPDGAKTLSQYLTRLDAAEKTMSTQGKFFLLSMLAGKLHGDASTESDSKTLTLEETYLNARAYGQNGGKCPEIHSLLAAFASHLGFADAGVHSGLWQTNGSTKGHDVAHFKDPATGEYYIQNYGSIINTHEKKLTDALNVSVRMLSAFTSVTEVESKPGKIHRMQTDLGRWVLAQVEERADFTPGKSSLVLRIGEKDKSIAFDVFSASKEGAGVKGFFVHSEFGPYSTTAIGIAGKVEGKYKVEAKLLDEIGYVANLYAGGLQVIAPRVSPDASENGTSWDRKNLFVGGSIKGTARISSVTGKLEIRANALDVGLSQGNASYTVNTTEVGVKVAPSGSPIWVEASRVLQLGPTAIDGVGAKVRTLYDKISVVVDTRGASSKVYLINMGEVYVMEGFENKTAVAIKDSLKLVIDAKDLGEFEVVANYTAMGPSKDPFYAANPSISVGASYTKDLGSGVTVGAGGVGGKGRPFFLLEDPGQGLPLVGPDKDKPYIRAQLWTRLSW